MSEKCKKKRLLGKVSGLAKMNDGLWAFGTFQSMGHAGPPNSPLSLNQNSKIS
jgi:hypothetical protein